MGGIKAILHLRTHKELLTTYYVQRTNLNAQIPFQMWHKNTRHNCHQGNVEVNGGEEEDSEG